MHFFFLISLATAADLSTQSQSCDDYLHKWDINSSKEGETNNDQAATSAGLKIYEYFRDHPESRTGCKEKWCKLTMYYANWLNKLPAKITSLRGKGDRPGLAAASGNEIKKYLKQAYGIITADSCPSQGQYTQFRKEIVDVPMHL